MVIRMKLHKNTEIILAILIIFLISFLVWNSQRTIEPELRENFKEIILNENQTIYSPEVRKEIGLKPLGYEERVEYNPDDYIKPEINLLNISQINSTKTIAFASQDLETISQAVGKAKYFVIYENCMKIKELENSFIYPDSNYSGHMSEIIPKLLANHSVDVLVGGYLGEFMLKETMNTGIEFSQKGGKIEEIIKEFCEK